MSKNEWKKWVGVVGRMLLAYALVFAQGAWATQNQATKDKAASPQKAAAQQANEKQSAGSAKAAAKTEQAQGEESESAAAEEKPSNDASRQGIKVHGHWTIEVRNPDGTLVTHREFENAYQAGSNVLPNLLDRFQTTGSWMVTLQTGICAGLPSGTSGQCTISEQGSGVAATFNTLLLSLNFPSPVQFVLNGTATAAVGGTITQVSTSVSICNSTISQVACATSTGQLFSAFTMATLTNPVSVAAGQTVAVTVAISFS